MSRPHGTSLAEVICDAGFATNKRHQLGLSQSDVAEIAKVSRQTVAKVEAGKAVSRMTVDRIARVLSVDSSSLIASVRSNEWKRPSRSVDERPPSASNIPTTSEIGVELANVLYKLYAGHGARHTSMPLFGFLQVEADDRVGLINDVADELASGGLNIRIAGTSPPEPDGSRTRGRIDIVVDRLNPLWMFFVRDRLYARLARDRGKLTLSAEGTLDQFKARGLLAVSDLVPALSDAADGLIDPRGIVNMKRWLKATTVAARVTVRADDRIGLLRDVTAAVRSENVNIEALVASDLNAESQATIRFTMPAPGEAGWAAVRARLNDVRGVIRPITYDPADARAVRAA
jgi:transcriptional regulator with XRE-family HTH domain